MLLKNNANYKVLLPSWMFERAKDKDEFKRLLGQYMAHYPHYRVIGIKDHFALCERRE